ncbi:MAG: FKBP-type peptidyl-prolyl cis-trans isomerase [Flavobacteriales bacterium]
MRILRFLPLLLIISCNSSDHPGFERLDKSVHFRLDALGDDDHQVSEASVLSLDCRLDQTDGTIVALKTFRRISKDLTSFPESIRNVLLASSEGDSMTLVGLGSELGVEQIFDPRVLPANVNEFELGILITEALTDEELRTLLAEERMERDLELKEQAQLAFVLDSLQLTEDDLKNGMYFKRLTETDGAKPKKGDGIKANYRSYISSGQLIDDTYAGHALVYQVGKPDQVLPGFATGIAQMREGEEAIFVIPSAYAYGEKGSSSGIVPPYSSMIYVVKLDKIGPDNED